MWSPGGGRARVSRSAKRYSVAAPMDRQPFCCARVSGQPKSCLKLGIEPVVNLPGVGRNLMDHPQIARQSGLTSFIIRPEHVRETTTFINTMLKARSSQSDSEIDIHLYPGEAFDERAGGWTLAFGVSLQYARSKGTVRLTSSDPDAELAIDHNYFNDPRDLEAICDGYELMHRIASTPPLREMLVGPMREGPHLTDREALKEVVRAEVGTTYHPSTILQDGADARSAGCRQSSLSGTRPFRGSSRRCFDLSLWTARQPAFQCLCCCGARRGANHLTLTCRQRIRPVPWGRNRPE